MTTFTFTVNFTCSRCHRIAELIQFSRYWNEVASFCSNEAAAQYGGSHKPELIQFSCAKCGEAIRGANGGVITGRKNMYNWLFDAGMLLHGGNVVTSTFYRFDKGEPPWKGNVSKEEEVPDEQCDPSLLP